MTKPLLHEFDCRCTILKGTRNRQWEEGDEEYCNCELRERINDARALDRHTIPMAFDK